MEILLLAGTYTLFKCGEASRVRRSCEFTQLRVTDVSKYCDLKHVSKHGPLLSLFEHYRLTNSRSSRSRAVTDVRAYRDIDDMLVRSL